MPGAPPFILVDAQGSEPKNAVKVNADGSLLVSGGSSGTPTAANVLDGFRSDTSTTAAATLITVPANRTWVGYVTVSCAVQLVGASMTTGQATGIISTAGSTVTPAAGSVFEVDALAGANVAGGTVGTQGNNAATLRVVVVAGTSSATVQAASTIAGTGGRVSFSVVGELQ